MWKIPNSEKKIYLTFDDGPIPEITEWLLNLLKKENIKATFFCIGENIQKHPQIFKQIISNDHSIGNHTFNHLNGWNTSTENYIKNIKLCDSIIRTTSNNLIQSKLFRPPYGRIKNKQIRALEKLGYKTIMWEVLSYDFDHSLSADKCLENTLKNISSGSIIVFHDSIKASKNLQFVLPRLIQQVKEKGFVFDKIS
jgi:peptidoglycan/xylan/chitin deacetylase (PgdA/CDA1 family)